MLTAEQKAYFDTFGFIVLPQYLTVAETAEITEKFDAVLAADRRGRPFDGATRQCVYSVPETHFPWLIEDERIYNVLGQILGPEFVWIGSDSNLYVGDTGWHPDTSVETPNEGIKVAFYLDPVAKDTGCLRVIPGSHRLPFHDDLKAALRGKKDDGTPAIDGRQVPCFPLESQPGDVVFFNHKTWHAAFGGRTGRRMFTLNVKEKPTSEAHLDFIRRTYQFNLKYQAEHQQAPSGRLYDDAFLQSGSPRIQGMVKPLVAIGLR
jgi:hypothetical protein